MERNKVIAMLERCWKHECDKCDWRDGASGYPWSCPLRNQAEKAAIELLKVQMPRVMTRKEIEDSDGSEFYSEHRDEEYMYLDHTEGSAYLMGNIDRLSLTKLRWEDYGKTWRCWTARPTDEQRKAVKWDD